MAAGVEVIVVLGADNLPDGTLTPMARARTDAALRLWRATPAAKILATGGFGPKFNVSTVPHAVHLMRQLQAEGVPEAAFLPFAESAHTVDDAVLAQKILAPLGACRLRIVTSRFHVPRARFIFGHFFPVGSFEFFGTPSRRSWRRLWRHWRHERESLQKLRAQGGLWVNGVFLKTPA